MGGKISVPLLLRCFVLIESNVSFPVNTCIVFLSCWELVLGTHPNQLKSEKPVQPHYLVMRLCRELWPSRSYVRRSLYIVFNVSSVTGAGFPIVKCDRTLCYCFAFPNTLSWDVLNLFLAHDGGMIFGNAGIVLLLLLLLCRFSVAGFLDFILSALFLSHDFLLSKLPVGEKYCASLMILAAVSKMLNAELALCFFY